MSEQPDHSPPVVLGYDDYVPAKDRRSNRLLYGFALGTILGGVFWGIVLFIVLLVREPSQHLQVAVVDGAVVSISFAIISLVTGILFLGLCVWARTKVLKEVRFATFRAAVLTGLVGGMFPYGIGRNFFNSDDTLGWYLLAALIWASLYPFCAGFWLCYRSALRD